MSDLRMTSGRLNLLRAVRDGLVWYSTGSKRPSMYTLRREGESWQTVTAKAAELRAAGWIDVAPPGASFFSSRAVGLTSAGEAVLAFEDQEASR